MVSLSIVIGDKIKLHNLNISILYKHLKSIQKKKTKNLYIYEKSPGSMRDTLILQEKTFLFIENVRIIQRTEVPV